MGNMRLLLLEKVIGLLVGHRSTRRMTLLSPGRRPFHQAGVGQDPILQFKRSIKPTAADENCFRQESKTEDERERLRHTVIDSPALKLKYQCLDGCHNRSKAFSLWFGEALYATVFTVAYVPQNCTVMFHKMAELVSTSFSPRVSVFRFPSTSFVSPFSEHANMSISVIRSHAPL